MSSWTEWAWDGTFQSYYRARKGPKGDLSPKQHCTSALTEIPGAWEYEYSKPMSSAITREMGPKYLIESHTDAHPIRAPTYLLQPNAIAGGNPVALCADLTLFEPEPRRIVHVPRDLVFVESQTGGQWMRTSLVVDKGTPDAKKDRRYQKLEGVRRVHDWRKRQHEW